MVLILIYLLILFIFLSVVYFFLQGPIFAPSSETAISTMLKLAKIKRGVRIADLGSGDGRVVRAFAKKGVEIHGYEINPLLVLISKHKIKEEGLGNNAFVHWRSFWKIDLSQFNIIIVFGIDYIMNRLKRKLLKELKPGSTVIANIFPFPDWKYINKKDGIYLYQIDENK